MNPVGIDFFTALPEVVESGSQSPAGQETDQGEFLTQFLSMLFAEPQIDGQSAEQLQLGLDGGQEAGHSISEDEEVLAGVINEEKSGVLLSAEIEPDLFSKQPTATDDSAWVAPSASLGAEAGKVGEETLVSEKDLPLSSEQRDSREGSMLWHTADEAPEVRPQEGGKARTPQFTESTDKLPTFQRPLSEPVGSGSSGEAVLNAKSKVTAPFGDGTRPEVPVSEARVLGKSRESSIAISELGNVKNGERLSPSIGQDRLPVVSPSSVYEREGSNQDGSTVRTEVRRAEADFLKPAVVAAGPDGQQGETRNQPGARNETHEEQLLRRLAVSKNPGQIDDTKRLPSEPDPITRFQGDLDKSAQGVGKPAVSEPGQFSDVLMSARPETNPLQGNEKVTLHEPLLAKGMVQGQSPENFDRIVDQIVKRMSLLQKGETFQLGVRLKPEFLGELRIETIMEADRSIRAVIHAEDSSVRALLEGKVAGLVQKFDEAGIHVDKVEIQTLLTDVGSGNDSSKDRQGLDHPASEKAVDSELGEQAEEASEEEIDDGHIHLFI